MKKVISGASNSLVLKVMEKRAPMLILSFYSLEEVQGQDMDFVSKFNKTTS